MADTADTDSNNTFQQEEKGWHVVKQHIIDNKVLFGLWVTRLFTIIFTFGYILLIFSNSYNIYYKVIMSNAATSALRLHQRVPRVQLSRQSLEQLFLEDSFHYLFYSLIFLYVAPVTLALIPIFLFALIHFSSYSMKLLDCLGEKRWFVARLFIAIVEFKARQILRLCAISEIIILPFTVLLVFTGHAGLLTPFIYFQFLKLRLASQRNPSTRNVFYDFRNELTIMSRNESVPHIIRRMIDALLSLTQQMAPVRQ